MKVELPRPSESYGYVEEISSTEVHFMQEVVLVNPNTQEPIPCVIAELDAVALATLKKSVK